MSSNLDKYNQGVMAEKERQAQAVSELLAGDPKYRPAAYRPESVKALLQALEDGLIQEAAAGEAGIGTNTMYAWLRDSDKLDFHDAFELSKWRGIAKMYRKWLSSKSTREAGPTIEALARRMPKEFAPVTRLDHEIRDKRIQLTPDEARARYEELNSKINEVTGSPDWDQELNSLK